MIQENRKKQSNVIVPDHIWDAGYTEDDLVYVVQEAGILIRDRGGNGAGRTSGRQEIWQ